MTIKPKTHAFFSRSIPHSKLQPDKAALYKSDANCSLSCSLKRVVFEHSCTRIKKNSTCKKVCSVHAAVKYTIVKQQMDGSGSQASHNRSVLVRMAEEKITLIFAQKTEQCPRVLPAAHRKG